MLKVEFVLVIATKHLYFQKVYWKTDVNVEFYIYNYTFQIDVL